MYALLQGSALLGYLFILGLVYGRWNEEPTHRAFRFFLWAAFGWAFTAFLLSLPELAGHELALKRLGAVFWLPINFWMIRFTYRLLERPRDAAYWVAAGMAAGGVIIYLFTDLGAAGFVRYEWGVSAERGPLHTTLSLIPAIHGLYAIGLLGRAISLRDSALARRPLWLLLIGSSLALVLAFGFNLILPVVFGLRGFPEFGAFSVFAIAPFLYWAMARHDFLSVSVERVADDLFQGAREGILLVDGAGTVRRMNDAARRMLAVDSEKAATELVTDILRNVDPTTTDNAREIELARGGRRRFVELSFTANNRRTPTGTGMLMMRDITKQKQAAQVLVRSRDRLEAEVRQRDEELTQAQKMEAIGTLAGGIAHDFNNILAAIVGFATAAKADLPADHPVHADLDEVLLASNRARDIVRQLMTFTRRREAARQLINVARKVKEALRLVQVSVPNNVTVRFEAVQAPITVLADATQLQQIVLNLAANAFHAMAEKGGTLHVRITSEFMNAPPAGKSGPLPAGTYACIEVADTGHGIAPTILPQIFNPFFTTKHSSEGTGLGLATARRIAHEHGGTITVDSIPGRGATFRVILPVTEGDVASDSVREDEAPGGSEKLFLVDDKEQVARAGKRLLEPLGYSVRTFTDPLVAWSAFEEAPGDVDLLITDQMMPDMTGIDLAKRMLAVRPELPVLLISGNVARAEEIRAATAGIRGFMPKPLERGKLAKEVRRLLDGSLPG